MSTLYFQQVKQKLAEAKRDFGPDSPEVQAASVAFANAGGVANEVAPATAAAVPQPTVEAVEVGAPSQSQILTEYGTPAGGVEGLAQYAAERGFGQISLVGGATTALLATARTNFTQEDIEDVSVQAAMAFLDIAALYVDPDALIAYGDSVVASTRIVLGDLALSTGDGTITVNGGIQILPYGVVDTTPQVQGPTPGGLPPNEKAESDRLDSLENQKYAHASNIAMQVGQNQNVMQSGKLRPQS